MANISSYVDIHISVHEWGNSIPFSPPPSKFKSAKKNGDDLKDVITEVFTDGKANARASLWHSSCTPVCRHGTQGIILQLFILAEK